MTKILIFGDDILEVEKLTAELKAADKHAVIGHRNGHFFRLNEIEDCDHVYVLTSFPQVTAAYGDKLVHIGKPSKPEAEKPVETNQVSQKLKKK